MELLANGYTLTIPAGTFSLSTDSIALSDFVRLPRNASVLDLGSGCGTLGLLLCARDANCSVTGVELDCAAHEAALKNIADNGLGSRMKSICADLRSIHTVTGYNSFSVCVSNPPYFSGGPVSTTPLARRDDCCSLDELFAAASKTLRCGGDFFLVHKPEKLASLCAAGAAHRLEPKRLCLLRHKEGGPVNLVMLQCRKDAKPGLIWEEQTLHTAEGSPTEYYRKLYHL